MTLEPIGQIAPQDWMIAPETQALIAALTADGAEVRFVGGCVRDAVLRRPIKDVDIATHDPPQRVLALLDEAGIHAIPTGLAHGTVTAVIGKAHYEITTLREDVETFGRHARVAFTDDWVIDAARRDFTMNAMFADTQGRIYDPFGGLQDLSAGVVRFVGDPMKRLEEDVLRLLRYFRFHAHYGRTSLDIHALAACRKMAPRLTDLSGERVAGELLRLLQAPDPAGALLLMNGEGILHHVLPEAKRFGRLRVLVWLETRAMIRPTIAPDPIRRLAIVLDTNEAGAKAVAERLKLSNAQRDRVMAIAAPKIDIAVEMDMAALRRALYRLGPDLVRDQTLNAWAESRFNFERLSSEESRRWLSMLDEIDTWRPVSLPVRGADAIALGVKRGPAIGSALAEVERWWTESDFRPGREECLDKLREAIESPPHLRQSNV